MSPPPLPPLDRAPGRASGRPSQGRPALLVLATLWALAGAEARADDWVDLLQPPGSPFLLQLDRSSVVPAGPGRFAAVWRVGSPSGQRQLVKRGVVDCAGEFLQAGTATELASDTAPGSYTGAVVDYRIGSRSWQGHTVRLTDAERAAAYDYPAPGSASALLVDTVCAAGGAASLEGPDRLGRPDRSDRPEQLDRPDRLGRQDRSWAARRLQAAAGCATPAGGRSPLCADDAATLATVGMLDLRLRQARGACQLDGGAAGRLQAAAFAAGSAPLLAALDDDLARAAAGLPCSQTAERLAQAADDDRLADARARFQACVDRMLPKLDDRVSDADVVATGLFGACRGELPKAVAQGPRLQNGLLPELTATVLEHRKSGRVAVPTPPRRRESQ